MKSNAIAFAVLWLASGWAAAQSTTVTLQGTMDVSEIRAPFDKGTMDGGNGAKQFAVGYVYNLSKLTVVYGTFSTLTNEGTFAQSIDAGVPGSPTKVNASGKSQGLERYPAHLLTIDG